MNNQELIVREEIKKIIDENFEVLGQMIFEYVSTKVKEKEKTPLSEVIELIVPCVKDLNLTFDELQYTVQKALSYSSIQLAIASGQLKPEKIQKS